MHRSCPTRSRTTVGRLLSLHAIIVLVACVAILPTTAEGQADATVVYLVRHAERAEDGTSDPVISLPGWDRSRLLADMLQDAGLTHIHTSNYRRTRGTARPTAEATGIEMRTYDARNLAQIAERLRSTPGRHLVIGHSNTTPQLVELLGGDGAGEIHELEYDRLYVVTLTDNGASTVLLRFGDPFER